MFKGGKILPAIFKII